MTQDHPAKKRFLLAIGLGTLAGLLCVWLAARGQPALGSPSHPIFWAILTDRMLIGMVVALAGAYTVHPVLGFPYRPWLRGLCLGVVVSLPLGAGAMGGPAPEGVSSWVIFFATLIAGGVYGLAIDVIVSRGGAEGAALLTGADARM
ncbi:MAG: hypothetical protein HQM03_17230 [Magnetococcales bacterium]|nr:hypothetical protein [Magnetococcales bacterium]